MEVDNSLSEIVKNVFENDESQEERINAVNTCELKIQEFVTWFIFVQFKQISTQIVRHLLM